MTRSPRFPLLLLLSVAQLMVILDISAVNVALPEMAQDLGIGPADIGWAITSYSLVFGSLLLLGGRAADLLGRRRVFLAGLTVFTVVLAGHGARRRRDDAVRRARRAGPRRGDAVARGALDHHHELPRTGAREGARRLGCGRRRRRRRRRAARRHAHRTRRLARDLLDQPPRRPRPRSRRHARSCPPTPSGRSGAASISAARCSRPPASAASCTPSPRRSPPAGPRRRRSASAPLAIAGLGLFAALELRTAQPLLRVQRLTDRAIGGGFLMMLTASAVLFGSFLLSSMYLQSVLGMGALETGPRVPSARLGDRARRARGRPPHRPRGSAPAAGRRLRDHDRRDAAAVRRQRATAATRATCCRAC